MPALAAMSAAQWVMTAAAAASAAAATASAIQQHKIAQQQAAMANQMAGYNAQVDIANARQLAMNANANINKQRTDDTAYLSAQRAAYAASGLLSGTGSPLALEATTAGRMEQDIQQNWQSVQQKESQLYASAQVGVVEGAEQADIYHLQGTAAIFQGIGGVANAVSQGASAYHQYAAGTQSPSLNYTPGVKSDFTPSNSGNAYS